MIGFGSGSNPRQMGQSNPRWCLSAMLLRTLRNLLGRGSELCQARPKGGLGGSEGRAWVAMTKASEARTARVYLRKVKVVRVVSAKCLVVSELVCEKKLKIRVPGTLR